MRLSLKQEIFSELFFEFLKSTISSKHFQTKEQPHS